ncbi:SAP domain-containing ribonucleoprotein [Oopsacas minuta]|uniref:SAP domain-containing ribonucleoprotein n=1 Tax=Oopsacas minuta TaxID=111878 RepID=A0AAV7JJX8_9METZ|nr:SAP domain-containing ribonucleoprotein [Oopsacas minuta]
MSQKGEGEDYLVININDLKKLRVSELKEKLSEFGLQTKGTKIELITRLEEHLSAAAESEEELALIDVANNSQPSDCVENIDVDTPVKSKDSEHKISDISFEDTSTAKLDDTTPTPLSPTKDLSLNERIKARGERFGTQTSDEAKKAMRLEKYGDTPAKTVAGGDLEKMKQRGERFGENVSKKLVSMSDKERQEMRKNRFASDSSAGENKLTKKIRLSS